jgi:alpha-aminoadipate carrier protein LysW
MNSLKFAGFLEIPQGKGCVPCSSPAIEEEQVVYGSCPECDAEIEVSEEIEKGEIVTCPDCGIKLEVVGLDPVEFELAPEEEEEGWEE